MAHYDWATLYEKLESCTDCGLCKGIRKIGRASCRERV